MKLDELFGSIGVLETYGVPGGEVLGLTHDSRHVRPGFVFVGLDGCRQAGWKFAGDAVDRGAIAIVSEHEIVDCPGVCGVLVADARQSLGELAAAFHGSPSDCMQIVGITGTNGKTTTAYMIRSAFGAACLRPGLVSTVRYEIGERSIPAVRTTPESPELQGLLAQMVSTGCKTAVMEVSSHGLVQKRTAGIDFDIGVFTNLTRDHLDYHHTMEKYFEAKKLLFRALGKGRKSAVAVINLDDPRGRELCEMDGLDARVITYGTDRRAEVRAEDVVLTPQGSSFSVLTPWGSGEAALRLLGRFNIDNALAAIASCGAAGVDIDCVVGALSRMESVSGRLEEVCTGKGYHVFVDYAHTDDALENVLVTLREFTDGRLIAVFGCGGNRDPGKRRAMGSVAQKLADLTILTSDNPRNEDPADIIAQIRDGFGSAGNVEAIEDRREAIGRAIEMAGDGDTVVIAGKGHESFQEFKSKTVPFDDRHVVMELLGKL